MQTKLPILTHQECSAHFSGAMPNDEICTLDTSRRRAACKGDEGGPLVYENRLLGILRFIAFRPWTQPDVFFNFNNPNTHIIVHSHVNAVRGVH